MMQQYHKTAKATTHNLIYSFDRYSADISPTGVYFPSRALLFKMMKACIDCEAIAELWVYLPPDSEEDE